MMFFGERAAIPFKAYRDGEEAEGLDVTGFQFTASGVGGFEDTESETVLEIGGGWYSFAFTPTQSTHIIKVSHSDSGVEIPDVVCEAENPEEYASRRKIASQSDLEPLAKSAELEAVAKSSELEPLLTSTNFYDYFSSINYLVVQNRAIKGVWEYAPRTLTDYPTVDASSLAKTSDVLDAKEAIISQCATATGFAKPDDVKLTTTTQTVDVSGLATLEGQNAIVSRLEKTPESVWNYGTASDRVVTAGNAGETGDVIVDGDSIAAKVWDYPERTLTQDVAAGSELEAAASFIVDSCRTAEGFSTYEQLEAASNGLTAKIDSIQPADAEAIAGEVWKYGGETPENRTVKASGLEIEGDIQIDADYEKIADSVWNAETRTLTGYAPIAPDDVSGGSYCTRADVERRWGIMNVSYWANTDNLQEDKETKTNDQILWAIETASRRIDFDLSSSMYVTPFSPIPSVVRKYCAVLAGIELYNSRRMQETEDSNLINSAMSDYHTWIASVLSGGIIAGATLFVSED